MHLRLTRVDPLRFSDGGPVRAASAVARLGDGVLVVQDDATHAAWDRAGRVTAVRLLPPVGGAELFAGASKHLKPDLEAACEVTVDGGPAVLLLGSGSSPARTRWVLLRVVDGRPEAKAVQMAPVYDAVAAALDVPREALNLEGACLVDGALRWFHRGLPSAGVPSGSVDLPLDTALAAATGRVEPGRVAVRDAGRLDLGEVGGVGLAVTDAVALPAGGLLLSAAAEDTPDPRDDGPVVASALVRLDGRRVADVVALPTVGGQVAKVEGLLVEGGDHDGVELLAVVDADDPTTASLALRLQVVL